MSLLFYIFLSFFLISGFNFIVAVFVIFEWFRSKKAHIYFNISASFILISGIPTLICLACLNK